MADYTSRVSEVGGLEIISVATSSIVQLGDRAELELLFADWLCTGK